MPSGAVATGHETRSRGNLGEKTASGSAANGTQAPEYKVARGRIELPTYRFSGGRSYQLSYLAVHLRTGVLKRPEVYPSWLGGPASISGRSVRAASS